jgi:hypothetical protein
MLIYLSERKIHNLCSEFNIDRGFIDAIMPDSIKTKWGIKLGVADGSIESQYAIQSTNHISQVLKKLKSKDKLIELISGTTYISPFNYYICDGKLSYEGRIDGYTSSLFSSDVLDTYRGRSFFADDKLKFKAKISHDQYQFINFTCTADSIQVFGGRNLSAYHEELFKSGEWVYYPHSGDPGILHRELPVRIIFWCLQTNETLAQITASPLMISC